ncbi:hypothetical protein BJ508DRAFT_360254 [Ascobolus immersus RN42]|uniref:C2H2-type domain-containing protein n=1 Tax=Ascobolus immersus RN42 TaxID=1160509 RepID=A0A3N4IBU1_ASCIM|nr:hypothetical protein BJ508DRAFT_360254 [Ascobolus immersus RN42]
MPDSNQTRPSFGSVMYGGVKHEAIDPEQPSLSFSSSESSSAGQSPVQTRHPPNAPRQPANFDQHQQRPPAPNFQSGSPSGRGRGGGRGGATRGGWSDWSDSGPTPRQIDRYRPPARDDNASRDGQRGGNWDFQQGGRGHNNRPSSDRGGFRPGMGGPPNQNRNTTISGGLSSADIIAAGTLIRPSPPRERGGRGRGRRLQDEGLVNEFSRDRAKYQGRLDSEEQVAFAFLCCLSEKEVPYCLHCHSIRDNWGALAHHLLAGDCAGTSTFKALRSSLQHQTITNKKAREMAELRSGSDAKIIPILRTYARECRPFDPSPAAIAAAEKDAERARANAEAQARARIQAQGQTIQTVQTVQTVQTPRAFLGTTSNAARSSSALSSTVSTPTLNTATLTSTVAQNSSYRTTGFYSAEEQDKFAFAFLVSAMEGDTCLQCKTCFDTLKDLDGHLRATKHFESQTYQIIQSLPSYTRVLEKAREVTKHGPNSQEKFFELLVARCYQVRDFSNTPSNAPNTNLSTPTLYPATTQPQSRKRKTLSYSPIYVGGPAKRAAPLYKYEELPDTDDFRDTAAGFTIRFVLPKAVREKSRTPSEDYRTYLEKRIVDQLSDTNPVTKPDLISIFSKPNSTTNLVYMDLYYSKQAVFMAAKERAQNIKVDGDPIPLNEIGATCRLEKYIIDVKPLTKRNGPPRPTPFASITQALDLVFKPLGYVDAKVEDVWGYGDSDETASQMVYLDQGLVIVAGLSFPVAEYKYPKTMTIDGQEMGLELRGRIKGSKVSGSGKRVRLQEDHNQMDLD